eukprot:XP_001705769.1 Hypothetical protein GL50803_86556 [Giardia lamblia ATCC 50803]
MCGSINGSRNLIASKGPDDPEGGKIRLVAYQIDDDIFHRLNRSSRHGIPLHNVLQRLGVSKVIDKNECVCARNVCRKHLGAN